MWKTLDLKGSESAKEKTPRRILMKFKKSKDKGDIRKLTRSFAKKACFFFQRNENYTAATCVTGMWVQEDDGVTVGSTEEALCT